MKLVIYNFPFAMQNFPLHCVISFAGMLKDQQDGSVLKAAVKPICGAREIKFYECLKGNVTDPNIEALRNLVSEYRGTVRMPFRGKTIDFIKLTDITHNMSEPCVMDIKIGKRTWDPLATPDKILAEEQKYEACKKNLGFCIPGFQVFDIKSGRIKRFGKDYGKKLNQNSVREGMFFQWNNNHSLILLMICDLNYSSAENFFEFGYSTVEIITDEIPINFMVNTNMGQNTNIITTLFKLIAISL